MSVKFVCIFIFSIMKNKYNQINTDKFKMKNRGSNK